MLNKVKITTAFLLSFCFLGFNAHAGLVKIDDKSDEKKISEIATGSYDGGNVGTGADPSGFWGSNLQLVADGTVSMLFEFISDHAAYNNAVFAGEGGDIGGLDNTIQGSFSVLFTGVADDFLPFSFIADCGGFSVSGCTSSKGSVQNGSNSQGDQGNDVSFFISKKVSNNTNSIYYLFFNDGTNDLDFDDMIVRLTVTPAEPPQEVPEPGALALLALGMIGFVARKRLIKR
ncbi:PEP-CTERM sorting domain-containing protein [Thalassotalea litorea]|uniref:PEP-CTERM sorting domain-containing protein n=1 Tax=Thalassotalea litorea TaxID=2020715 RepID=A0A5R9IEG4_9GAMM|nr:PEP-CTERM sorting domain-containing protein [Thalassotalea litorea]TLU60000.1 PEP-CTERM sorting domain-containing protein [Thalassotalea litorea]